LTSNARKHCCLLYNPHAGSAVSPEWWVGKIVHKLCGSGYEVTTIATTPETDAQEILGFLQNGPDLLVATGGDGTIRIALEAASLAPSKIPVGIVPAGTGNQLARNLGLYDENLLSDPLDRAVDTLVHGKPFTMDLGIMNGHRFAVAAGVGPMSDAILMPEYHNKVNWKMLAYAGSLVQTLAQAPLLMRVTVDEEETITVAAAGVFVTNIADLGIGLLSESARLDDGILDLCILKPKEFHDYLEMGFRFAGGLGGEQDAPYYVKKVTRSVKLEVIPVSRHSSLINKSWRRFKQSFGFYEKPPLVLNKEANAMIDGDACGTTPMTIEIAPLAVTVMVPLEFPTEPT
jgi:diacylglycerol kinase family enzyme